VAPAVEIRGLSYTYPDGCEALRETDLSVAVGESLGLMGPNGAGKSTLLLHLNGVLPAEGRVLIQGLPVTDRNLGEIRRLVGMVFQDPDDQLFMPRLLDDVAFGPLNLGWDEQTVCERSRQALELVGLSAQAERPPHHLSLGQKKRAALATVLVMEPEILVLDEATSGLDPRGRREIIQFLGGLTCTKIIATHDVDLVQDLCDRVAVMDEGRIVALGAAEDILTDAELLFAHGLEQPRNVSRRS